MHFFRTKFHKCIAILLILSCIPNRQKAQPIDFFIQTAIKWQEAGQFNQAISALEEALPLLEKRDSANRWFGLIHCNIGYVNFARGDYNNTIKAFKKGLAYYDQDSLKHLDVYLYTHFDMGMAYLEQHAKKQEQAHLRDSADLYLSIALELKDSILPPEHLNHAILWQKTGDALYNRADYENANTAYSQAFHHLQRYHPNQHQLVLDISKNLGRSFRYLEQPDSALVYFEACLQKSKVLFPKDSVETAIAYYDVAAMLHATHTFERAFETLNIAIATYPDTFPAYIGREFRIKAAGYYFENHQLDLAEQYYLKTLNYPSQQTIEEIEIESLSLLQLIVIYTRTGRMNDLLLIYDRACGFFRQNPQLDPLLAQETCKYAAAIAQIASPSQETMAEVVESLSGSVKPNELPIDSIALALGIDTSLLHYEPQQGDSRYYLQKANQLSLMATRFLLKGNVPKALQTVQQGFEHLVPSFQSNNELFVDPAANDFTYHFSILGTLFTIKCQTMLMKIERQTYTSEREWNYAFRLFDTTDKVLQRVRRTGMKLPQLPFAENVLAGFYSNMAHLYGLKFQLSQNPQYAEKAIQSLEKRKAINLLEKLKLKSLRSAKPAFAQLQRQEQQLLSRVNQLSVQIADQQQNKKEVSFNPAVLDSLQEAYFMAYQKFSEFYADIKIKFPSYYQLNEVPDPVKPSELAELLDDQTAILSFYLTGELLSTVVMLKGQPISVRLGVKLPELKKWVQVVRSSLNSRGTVNTAYKEAATKLYQTLLPQLPDRIKQIIISPDGLLYNLPFDALLTQSNPSGVSLTALPFLIKKYSISYGASATLIAENIKANKIKTNSYEQWLVAFGPEDDTYIDAQGLDRIFDATVMDQRIQTRKGTAATKSQFFQSTMRSSRIIQVDAHGAKADNLENYSVNFCNLEKLYLPELMTYNLQNDLFILSSCDLGSGEIMAAEGLLGFVRGLQFAGAKNVITSKNRLLPKASQILLTEFYRQVFVEGKSYSAALQSAKVYLIRSSNYSDPFFWGGITLFGR